MTDNVMLKQKVENLAILIGFPILWAILGIVLTLKTYLFPGILFEEGGEMSNRLKNRIREVRERAGLSQFELAQQLGGITTVELSAIEHGKRAASKPMRRALARVLKIPEEELFYDEIK